MEQLIEPNYNQTVDAGMCQQYARLVFGVKAYYDPSWDNWKNLKYKHQNRDFPDASVPVWFNWWGKLKGDLTKKQYGHTAVRDKSGRVYSSPLSGKGHAWFNSIDDLVKAFGNGMEYVGWSEDINNIRVVQPKEEKNMTSDEVKYLFLAITHKQPTATDIQAWTTIPAVRLATESLQSDQWLTQNEKISSFDRVTKERDAAQEQLKSLTKQLAEKGTSEDTKKLQAIKDALK